MTLFLVLALYAAWHQAAGWMVFFGLLAWLCGLD